MRVVVVEVKSESGQRSCVVLGARACEHTSSVAVPRHRSPSVAAADGAPDGRGRGCAALTSAALSRARRSRSFTIRFLRTPTTVVEDTLTPPPPSSHRTTRARPKEVSSVIPTSSPRPPQHRLSAPPARGASSLPRAGAYWAGAASRVCPRTRATVLARARKAAAERFARRPGRQRAAAPGSPACGGAL